MFWRLWEPKKKLITTNKDVITYDFYRPENIYVYDDKIGFNFKSIFFTKEYRKLPKEVYDKYSLKNWLKEIFL